MTDRVASGVTSRGPSPVPPVVSIKSTCAAIGPFPEGVGYLVLIIGHDDIFGWIHAQCGNHFLDERAARVLALALGPEIAAGEYAYVEWGHVFWYPQSMIAR